MISVLHKLFSILSLNQGHPSLHFPLSLVHLRVSNSMGPIIDLLWHFDEVAERSSPMKKEEALAN